MSPPSGRDRIFISYRREETAAYAGRLYDRLSDHFGEGRVFMDVDSIAIGLDFAKALQEAVSGCEILLALIGRDWLDIADSAGRRRIDNPNDWIRVELETALQRDIRVVPVLIDGALLPQAVDLPPSLRPLVHRQTIELTHTGFRSEVSRLIEAIDEVFDVKPDRTAEAPKPDRGPTVIQQGKWKLELLTRKGAKATFRLSSGQEVHIIAVNSGFAGYIRVDEQSIAGGWESSSFTVSTEYPVPALSSRLGSDVTIKVNDKAWQAFRFMSLTVRIGELVLKYE